MKRTAATDAALAGAAAVGGLSLRRLGVDTYQEPVAYLRSDCPVCKSEGFESRSRIEVWHGERHIVATLNVVHGDWIGLDQLGLSEAAWRALGGGEGAPLRVAHAQQVASMSAVRAKIYGRPIGSDAAQAIVRDVVDGRYSDIELAALITACSGDRMDVAETIALTRAMVAVGQRLHWNSELVVDKHCVGGLPGNRTTLLVVPIVAACGLTIPKTSSRAITSPAGTADTMETLAPVALDLPAMRRVVEREGGCIAWGGAVSLSPADDMLIRVERPLGLDSDGMMVASVLSKKIAAGSTHVVIDIPVGRTAKVRSRQAAHALAQRLDAVGAALGINVSVMLSDGSQPVGHGVGPALEAWDVLAVLQNQTGAPDDLRQRALQLAGRVLELGRKAAPGDGVALARSVLDSGAAWNKLQAICEAQGGMRTPPRAAYTHVLTALHHGRLVAIDNRRLARLAKLAGAPKSPAAGLALHAPLGAMLSAGQPLLTLHAESPGELAYALAYAESQDSIFSIQEA
ncbi:MULTISPECIES: thymidine phosphorylase family protein [unclassified Duganella]|uniref:thymidine phosphorylase family protein n=1 Tax=unclassified Duganella TaxID=2636909 RepID=UPI000E342CAC|nr:MULTISPECIES: thymidine phosphorylase family protein [unclassified Duganella]RFP19554.1 thymidine phosphorylase family protein [Duganella sp. BJB475]RFP36135.1 thymidine phosphorylase family protein [Duganella sp. BJB476]